MLNNVPSDLFGRSLQQTVANSLSWLIDANNYNLMCANGQYKLLYGDSHTSWDSAKFWKVVRAMSESWDNW